MSDSDPIKVNSSKDDLLSILAGAFGGLKVKYSGLLFIVFIIISSDVFINKILGKIPNATDLKMPTSYGTLIQGLILVIMSILIDALITHGVI